MRDKKKLPEEEAAVVLQQLLHSLQFCHRKDVSLGAVGRGGAGLGWAGWSCCVVVDCWVGVRVL